VTSSEVVSKLFTKQVVYIYQYCKHIQGLICYTVILDIVNKVSADDKMRI